MPQIVLILREDDGRETEQVFDLSGELSSLDAIDEAVERFKSAALPQVEQQLLTRVLERALEQEKKTRVES